MRMLLLRWREGKASCLYQKTTYICRSS
jgi:hypothetical protein